MTRFLDLVPWLSFVDRYPAVGGSVGTLCTSPEGRLRLNVLVVKFDTHFEPRIGSSRQPVSLKSVMCMWGLISWT